MADGVRRAVAGRLLSILAEIKQMPPDAVSLGPDDDFLTALAMDSIHAVELTLQLDAVFQVGFGEDPDDVDHLASFGRLVDLVMARGQLEGLQDDDSAVGEPV